MPLPPPASSPSSARIGAEVAAVAVLGFVLAALATALDGWPIPHVFDEFSQILAGETFASGRLANPPHALPEFFRTIHVIQTPTYASKYFPGHGLFLALGIVLGGGARLGQWLAFAVMAGALHWMLRAWASRWAALAGSLLFVVLVAETNWASGYWGAAVAAAGSALVFGALPRIRARPAIGSALALGAGVVFLALTRPFEGLVVSLVPAASMAVWLFRGNGAPRDRWLRVAAPCLAVIAAGGVLLAAHNRATTGSAWRPAYAVYEAQSPGAPPFVWQRPVEATVPLSPPEAQRYKVDMGAYNDLRNRFGRTLRMRARVTTAFYLPHAAVAAGVFVLAVLALGDGRRREAALAAVLVVAATCVSSFYLPHYIAPALPPLVMLCVVGAELVAARGRRFRGAVLAGAVLVAAGGIWRLATMSNDERDYGTGSWANRRLRIAQELDSVPGRHLVLVHYGATYGSQHEFVQNGADRAGARVLWAHDLGDADNERLLAVERDRKPWRLSLVREHGRLVVELMPYERGVTRLPPP